MEFRTSQLCIAQLSNDHPMKKKSLKLRISYIKILEYFTNKYSIEDKFAQGLLKNYEKILIGDAKLYDTNKIENKCQSERLTTQKLSWSSVYSFKYSIAIDVLFINAFTDAEKAKSIIQELKKKYLNNYPEKLDNLYEMLYSENVCGMRFKLIKNQIACWSNNRSFLRRNPKTLLVTATMSAGKSTLINALVGKCVNRTMNDACTAKLHIIYDKAYEDGFSYEWDHDLDLNADRTTLLIDNDENPDGKIYAATYFNMFIKGLNRLKIIDTPGVNSSTNIDHFETTKSGIKNISYNKMIYVINAEQIGTNDDHKYLSYIAENIEHKKIIFVLNKLDKFRSNEDSIILSLENLKKYLNEIGFNNPVICPVSSYAGLLSKRKIWNDNISEDEEDEYELLKRRLKKEEYNLSKYYRKDIQNDVSKKIDMLDMRNEKAAELLHNSGILCLEEIISRED